ncbi:MmgE/PrpD family protein [Chloroflexota bacterium]
MTIARKLADYALGYKYENLPEEVIHAAKRRILDTLGCAIGGYNSTASEAIREVISGLGTSGKATVIGSGLKANCPNAALANGMMTRYLDYMDQVTIPVGNWYGYAHPSEVIPGLLAMAEREHLSGTKVINSTSLAYDLSARFAEAAAVIPIAKKGFAPDTLGIFVMPIISGKLLGLNATQIENAIGISGSHGMVLGILDAAKETNTMAKNMRFPNTAYQGIMAAFLAEKGFTGPTRVLEGESGFISSVMGGDFDIGKLVDFDSGFRILKAESKAWAACGTIQGHLNATLNIVNEHDLKPADVASIQIWAGTRSVQHTGDPAKHYPKNKETADHSAHYVTAVAIKERALGPAQYASEKYDDPVIKDLISKISFDVDMSLDKYGRAGITEITTHDGKVHSCRIEYPKGHPDNPMTDEEINDKFYSLAEPPMGKDKAIKIIDTVYSLEQMSDIGQLMDMLVF